MLFGKLPAHGDFVSRGIGGAERDGLDDWLSTELARARDVLRDSFEENFDMAPPWRFAWRENEGESWTAGAMAPSMDSVGRRFPIMVARRAIDQESAAGAAEACEDAIYEALSGGWDADRLVEGVAAIAPQPGEEAVERDGWWTLGSGDLFAETRLGAKRPTGLILKMLTTSEAEA